MTLGKTRRSFNGSAAWADVCKQQVPMREALECQILDQVLKMQPGRLCWVSSGTSVGIREDSSAESPPG